MRESPVTSFIKTPWWINLVTGLGLMAFGELLKIAGLSGRSPGKIALGQSLQFISLIFLVLAAISFLIACFREFSGAKVRRAETAPAPPRPEPPRPAAPPPPPKKQKYTERDFMPAALRAELDAREAPAGPGSPLAPPPPPGKGAGDDNGLEEEKDL